MNLCRDCKWFDGDRRCTRWRWTESVWGVVVINAVYCDIERDCTTRVAIATTPEPCGPSGKHFEAAPKPAPVAAKRPWWKTFMRAMGQVAGRLQQDGGEAGSTPARSRKLCRAGAWLCRAALRGLGYYALVLAGVGVARIDSLGVVCAEVVIGHLLICAAGHRLFRKLP